jgi:3-oxoadipate enol-lactonase
MQATPSVFKTSSRPALAAESWGDGVPVVFVHGIGGNRKNWDDQLAFFASRHRAVALDLRGYGDSDDIEEELDFHDFADDVVRVLDHLELTKVHLVGLSMGGLVAQSVYARQPDRILSLTLAACRPGSAPVFSGEQKEGFIAARLQPLLSGGVAALATSLAPALLGSSVSDAARSRIQASLRTLRAEMYVKTLQARTNIAPFLDLAEIRVPALVIAAGEDRVAPVAQMKELAAAIPGSEFALIEDSGHLVNIERPLEFNRVVIDFIDRVRPAPVAVPGF